MKKYEVTIREIETEGEKYNNGTEIYQQTVADLHVDSVIGAVNSFPVSVDELKRRNGQKEQE